MKRKKLIKGDSIFGSMIKQGGYFVDKTLFIKEFIESGDKVLLMPRPRRFGKTLNLSMLEYFFDVRKADEAHIFNEFNIAKEKEITETHQNRYPVINLSLKSIKTRDWSSCKQYIKKVVSDLYRKHLYLQESEHLDSFEKENFNEIVSKNATIEEYAFSLKDLGSYLKNHYNQDVIILVDEYDTPIISGYKYNFYAEIIDFMKTFLGEAFKENEYLHKGLITGILRIAKESIFSEMNNLGVFTIFKSQFSDFFGFTEEETKQILRYFIPDNNFSEIKKWYDGYTFGRTDDIYNPWSVVNYISNHEDGFDAYWVRSGTDDLITKYFLIPENKTLRDDIKRLLEGKTLKKEIEKDFIFPNLDRNSNLLWSLLLFTGYLKPVERAEQDFYYVTIPNLEVKQVYTSIVKHYFNETIHFTQSNLYSMLEYLQNADIKNFKKLFADFVYRLSYHDFAGEKAEQVYHAFVLGLLVYLQNSYQIYSNIESGEGRPDILLAPHDKAKHGIIIEFKTMAKDAADTEIDSKMQEGFRQIAENRYFKMLTNQGIHKHIELVMVFSGKKVSVKERFVNE